MKFARPKERRVREHILPMINVVFLLLIFFLLSAQIAPPRPIDISLPMATSEQDAQTEESIYLGADGTVAYFELRDEAAWAALNAQEAKDATVSVFADAQLEAIRLANVLSRLRNNGFVKVNLITEN
ncbi:MAG: biopolymer transporter ExbD [Pseudomonadota bacterium]